MKKIKVSTLCTIVEVAFVVIFCVGLIFNTGSGTLSATGFPNVFALCPIGGITAFLSSKTFIPQQIIALVLFLAFVVIFGRAFCGWICPIQLWYKIWNRNPDGSKKRPVQETPPTTLKAPLEKPRAKILGAPRLSFKGGLHDSRNWILAAALLAALVVSFPVFCLICPIGLSFASVICLWNLIQFNVFNWGLVVFPLVLAVEILVLRRWCHTLCPVAAALSWVARMNKTFVPILDGKSCLRKNGSDSCTKCNEACPEEIDLHHPEEGAPLHECTKCHLCAEACPVSAIRFPFLSKKKHPTPEDSFDQK